MIDPRLRWKTSCELLGACAADVQASALKVSSFTEALRNELSKNTYDVLELRSVLCSTEKQEEYSLIRYPHYQDVMGLQSECNSVVITKLGSLEESEDHSRSPSEILDRIRNMTDGVMCVAVTFKCDAKAFMEEIEEIKNHWRRWFKSAPSESEMIIVRACQGTSLIGAWNSNSYFTQWALPLWLWDAMEPPSGYHGIGMMHPQNYASGIQDIFAESDCSSDILAGEATLSLCPSTSNRHSSIQDTILEGITGEYLSKPGSIMPLSIISTKNSATSEPLTRHYSREQLLVCDTADTQDDSTVPDYSSNIIVGEPKLLSRPSTPGKVFRIQEMTSEGTMGEDTCDPESIMPPAIPSTEGSAPSGLVARNYPQEQPLQCDTADTQDISAVPDNSSDNLTGEAKLLLQPSTPDKVSRIQGMISEDRPQEDLSNLGSIMPLRLIPTEGSATSEVLMRSFLEEEPPEPETDVRGQWRETESLSTLYNREKESSSSDSESSNTSSVSVSPVSTPERPTVDGPPNPPIPI